MRENKLKEAGNERSGGRAPCSGRGEREHLPQSEGGACKSGGLGPPHGGVGALWRSDSQCQWPPRAGMRQGAGAGWMLLQAGVKVSPVMFAYDLPAARAAR